MDTSNETTGPVDVLAVLEFHANGFGNADNRGTKFSAKACGQVAAELRGARAAVAELVAADREYDAAKDALAEAKREKGNWRINPLGHNHPAVVRSRAATDRRRLALAAFGGA